jgi:hypothetical protein
MKTIYFKDDKQVTESSLFEHFMLRGGDEGLDRGIAIPCSGPVSLRKKRYSRHASAKMKQGKGAV